MDAELNIWQLTAEWTRHRHKRLRPPLHQLLDGLGPLGLHHLRSFFRDPQVMEHGPSVCGTCIDEYA